MDETIGLTASQFAELIEENVDFKNNIFSFVLKRYNAINSMEIYLLNRKYNNLNPTSNMEVYREAARIAFTKLRSNNVEHI